MLLEGGIQELTRRQVLAGATAAAAASAGLGAYGVWRFVGGQPAGAILGPSAPPAEPVQRFQSRPDLRPAGVTTTGRFGGPGHLFIGPGSIRGSQSGPLIIDSRGAPVWFRPLARHLWETNFRVANFGGQEVLAWWQGEVQQPAGYGYGEAVILDGSYRELRRVRAAGGRWMDMHELQLTPDATALFTCFPRTVRADLSHVGGPRDGHVLESVFQELDLRTGRLLFEWRSLEHIPVTESYRPLEHPYDYLHINSIDVLPDGNLLVSARHTWALYKLERGTGNVIWRLGGKRSDFTLDADARFSWQHDARQLDSRTITLFDDGSDGPTTTESQSRALVLDVDPGSRRVALARAYTHPQPLLAAAMGSVQMLEDGHVLVGWGSNPSVSEFSADGTLVADLTMSPKQQSYRAYRLHWAGTPEEPPAVATTSDPVTGQRLLYVSWNGSTEVTHWQVWSGIAGSRIAPRRILARAGFETAIPLHGGDRYAAVAALDCCGRELARSATIAV